MLDDKERESIINEAVEKAILLIPEIVGNLITNQVALSKLNSKFYKDHPEFADNKDIVASVIEMIESKNPTEDYSEVLKKAVPEVKKRIKLLNETDTKNVSRPDRRLKDLDFNGAL